MNATVLIGDATLHNGDCLEVMRGMDAESVTAFVRIELDAEYFEIARRRIEAAHQQLKLVV